MCERADFNRANRIVNDLPGLWILLPLWSMPTLLAVVFALGAMVDQMRYGVERASGWTLPGSAAKGEGQERGASRRDGFALVPFALVVALKSSCGKTDIGHTFTVWFDGMVVLYHQP